MKIIYRQSQLLLFVIGLLFMVQCSPNLGYQEAMNKNEANITDSKALEDAKFLVEAKSYNILAGRLAEIAIKNGYAASIVKMANETSGDHKNMTEDINSLAKSKKIKVPSSMNEDHRKILDEAEQTSREDFDKNYIRLLRRVNTDNTSIYMSKATEAHDADVRAFAARKLDMLRAHATKIDDVEKELLNTY